MRGVGGSGETLCRRNGIRTPERVCLQAGVFAAKSGRQQTDACPKMNENAVFVCKTIDFDTEYDTYKMVDYPCPERRGQM